jgi:hypothetical protein
VRCGTYLPKVSSSAKLASAKEDAPVGGSTSADPRNAFSGPQELRFRGYVGAVALAGL